jgi:AcrR family transcriptional regulator
MPFERVKLSEEMLEVVIGESWSRAEVSAAAELLAGSEGQFPSGVRSLPPGLVSAVQRERLLAAMLRASADLGYRELNVQDVLDRAGVSRPTFYEHFENKESCFLAAFDAAAERLRRRVEAGVAEGEGIWRDRVRHGLDALLQFVTTEPDAAMTLIVEARAACPAALVRRDELMDHFASCLDSKVRAEVAGSDAVSPIAAAGIVGGVEALLYNRINRGDTEDLESLVPSLMYFAVLPYEGHETAISELGAAAPAR